MSFWVRDLLRVIVDILTDSHDREYEENSGLPDRVKVPSYKSQMKG